MGIKCHETRKSKLKNNDNINRISKLNNNDNINILGEIKSKYIVKEIFSYLDENIKLKMIIYNKKYQNLFGIDIENYKNHKKKYFIGDKNGKGAEYTLDTNKLIFKGEYLNGKRNGKGKEYYKTDNDYDKSPLKFKGKYKNGYKIKGKKYTINGELICEIEKNGTGKEFYENGKLQFEGEFFNGKKWNGIGYNIDGNIEYELKNGRGKIKQFYYNGKLEYEGEYLNGKKHGKGKDYNQKGKLIFEGEYLNGKRQNGIFKECYEKKNGKLKQHHEWDGCICTRCKEKRDKAHTWDGCKCTRCGRNRDLYHSFVDCVCTRCGQTSHVFEYIEEYYDGWEFPNGVDACTENLCFAVDIWYDRYRCRKCGETKRIRKE